MVFFWAYAIIDIIINIIRSRKVVKLIDISQLFANHG